MATAWERLSSLLSGEKPQSSSPGKAPASDSDISDSHSELDSLKTSGVAVSKSQRGTRKPSKAEERIKEIQLAETLEKLYDPKNFKPIGKLYFNVRYGVTGWEGFLLTPIEEETIAASFAMLTEALWLWDPRLLALVIAGGNIGSIVAQKEITFNKLQKARLAASQTT